MATVIGGSGDDQIDGTADGDSLSGNAGQDTISGQQGADTLSGGDDHDTLFGGAGNDTVRGDTGDDRLSGGMGNDSLTGGDGADTLYGGQSFTDIISDEDFSTSPVGWTDAISGAPVTATGTLDNGDPYLGGFAGNGTGNEQIRKTFDLTDGAPHAVIEFDLIKLDSWDENNGSGVNERLVVYIDGQPAFSVTPDGYGSGFGDGADTSGSFAGGTWRVTATTSETDLGGSAGWTDRVYHVEIILNDPGDSVTLGFGSSLNQDISDESFGIDNLRVLSTDDPTNIGQDTLDGGTGDDVLTGGDGADNLTGGAHDDQVFGGGGNDTLEGSGGSDSLQGGDGADLIHGDYSGSPFADGGNATVIWASDDWGNLIRINNVGETASTTVVGNSGVVFGDIGMAPDGTLYGIGFGDDTLYTIDSGTGVATAISSIGWANALSFDEFGNMYANTDGGSTISQIDPNNPSQSSVWWTDPNSGWSAGDVVFVGDTAYVAWISGTTGQPQLLEFTLDDDNNVLTTSVVGTLPADAFGLTADADGNLYVLGTVNGQNGLSRIDLSGAPYNSGADPIPLTFIEGSQGLGQYWGATSNAEALLGRQAAGNDTIEGAAGNDTVLGDVGDDLLSGDAGNDSVSGGSGDDTIRVGEGSGSDSIQGGEDGETSGDLLDATGMTSAAVLDLSAGDPANTEDGTLTHSGGVHSFSGIERILLGQGGDTVVGSTESDSVDAGGGDDLVSGGAGDDNLAGGSGADTVSFSGPVTDYAFDDGPSGELIVTDLIGGRDGTDTLTGFEYAEFNGVTFRLVTGNDGSNTTLQGLDDGTPSLIIAHDGADWGGGHATSDAVFGGAGNDTLDGGDGDDTLVGEGDDDLLRGDGGNDQLFGGDGNDTLQGGAGNDTLTSGDGADVFSLTDGGGSDRITDFDMTRIGGRTVDQLDVSGMTNAFGNPVTWRDVVVTDTNGDGSGDAVLTFANGEAIVLQGVAPDDASGKQNMAAMGIPCFVAGTPILTPGGWRPIECLAHGDEVITETGVLRVIWAGSRHVSSAELRARPMLRPVHFPVGAIGNSRPLRLSPQHAVVMHLPSGERRLVRARHLAAIGFGHARIVRGTTPVRFHHILLERHAVLCAAGAAAESLYPGGQAMEMLDWPARLAISAAVVSLPVPGFCDETATLLERYGDRVYPLVSRRVLTGLSSSPFAGSIPVSQPA